MDVTNALDNSIFEIVGKAADQIGQETYVVGGFVRDYFLKREQKQDLDFVTVGSGIKLAEAVKQSIPNSGKLSVFKRFGTAMFKVGNMELEFVGARKESYHPHSRKPTVENGSLLDDQNRRDFTINAMAIALNQENYGHLIDPFQGLNDLESQTIKTPLDPDITFSDDPLRMMRAIRFAAQLGFQIDPDTFQGILNSADRIKIVSKERIVTEIHKIMLTDKPSMGLAVMEKAGLMNWIMPELTALKGIDEIEGHSHKDNFYHTLEVVDNISQHTDNLWLRWAALLHDIGKARTKRFDPDVGWTFHSHEFVGSKMVYRLFKRLKMPLNEHMKYVQKLVLLSSRPIALVDDDTSDSALRRLLFDAGEDLEDLFTLCKADITTKNPKRQKRYQLNFVKVEEKIKEVEERDRVRNFQPPIDGKEIMEIFDLKPGKEVGILKTQIKEAILEGLIENNRESAYKYLLDYAKSLNLFPKDQPHDL